MNKLNGKAFQQVKVFDYSEDYPKRWEGIKKKNYRLDIWNNADEDCLKFFIGNDLFKSINCGVPPYFLEFLYEYDDVFRWAISIVNEKPALFQHNGGDTSLNMQMFAIHEFEQFCPLFEYNFIIDDCPFEIVQLNKGKVLYIDLHKAIIKSGRSNFKPDKVLEFGKLIDKYGLNEKYKIKE
jgi:hypothetical protein